MFEEFGELLLIALKKAVAHPEVTVGELQGIYSIFTHWKEAHDKTNNQDQK